MCLKTLTLTSDTSIFCMNAVVHSNCIVTTVNQSGLSTPASHIVQKDTSGSLAKLSKQDSSCTCGRRMKTSLR